jgi:hypothetical protein
MLACAAAALFITHAHAQSTQDLLTPDSFERLHRMIRPQSGELRFNEVPWLLSVHDARVQAAKEGKPLLIWSGSGGAPLGVC